MANSPSIPLIMGVLVGTLTGLAVNTLIFFDDEYHFLQQVIGDFDDEIVYWSIFGFGLFLAGILSIKRQLNRGYSTTYLRSVLFLAIVSLCYFTALYAVAFVYTGRMASVGVWKALAFGYLVGGLPFSFIAGSFFRKGKANRLPFDEPNILDHP